MRVVGALWLWAEETFISRLEIIVTRKQKYTITLDQGWFTVKEMRDDLGWSEFEPQTFWDSRNVSL